MTIQLKNYIFKNEALYDGVVSNSKMLCHIKNGVLYKGYMTSQSNAVAVVKDGKIYDGYAVRLSALKGFAKGDVVYAGNTPRSSAIVLMRKSGDFYLGNIQKSSAKLDPIKGAEWIDLALFAALFHYFISPIF